MSTVLIVDAFPAVRKALRRLLERQLCSVDAIAKTEVSPPGSNHSGSMHAGDEWI